MTTRKNGYNALLRLLQRFADKHSFSKQSVCRQKKAQKDLEETRITFDKQFHGDHLDVSMDCVFDDMCPSTIWVHSRTIDELIENTESSYDELPMETLSKTFITLQKVMEKTLETFGTNDYKIPHMNKNAIKDLTLYNVRCDPSVHKNAVAFLSQRPLNSQT
ncbi:hypothetical protein H257_19063 [Aphanomyces astaci]|uniref:Uncharacterized protein n=1 Tax=Aphanomyces astaci TaxID=112090 RepID=W4FAQ1_APHAT|nr:hypothetical protein H257_19063 [Aphanomyces astaci]ETV64004.1 hypothetical protein H257_19063 [Aphanomyces astaci]|eukprot:XP_009846514.1 hypothetical protein H257_19063 [Aphanomyces astaci]